MKKTLLSTLAVAWLLSTAGAAVAQDAKPIVTVAFAGVKELKSDIDFIGKLSDNPDLIKHVDGAIGFLTNGAGLDGLDESRPWGLSVSSDGIQFNVVAFLPVTSLDKLLAALGNVAGQPEDAGDGVKRIQAGPMPLFVKEKGGWAFLGQSAESLANLPADPVALLGGLEKKYDIAVRVGVQNIPEVFRQLAVDGLRQVAEGGLEQGENESDDDYQKRAALARAQIESVATMINDVDELTLGFAIDSAAKVTYFDFSITAVAGSKTAKQFASMTTEPSKFTGFLIPGAVVTAHVNSTGKPTEEDIQQSVTMFKGLRGQIEGQLDEAIADEKLRAPLKEALGEVMNVAEETVKTGRTNGGLAVVGEGPFTAVAGMFVADGEKLEKVVKKLVDMGQGEPNFPQVKLDADNYKGVRLHTLSMPIPPNEENAEMVAKVVGDPIQAAVGFSKDSMYLAVGPKSVDTIKQVIDKSEGGGSASLPPMQFTVSLQPILKFAAAQDDSGNPMLAALVEALKGGKDHVAFTATNIKDGMNMHLEAEEGVLKLIGTAIKMGMEQGGVGALN